MRKSILLILLGFIFLSGCTSRTPTPYGKWKSDDPDLLLDINPIHTAYGPWEGQYLIDGEVAELYIIRHVATDNFFVDMKSDNGRTELCNAAFTQKGSKLYFDVRYGDLSRKGYKQIVFDLIETYAAP